MRVFIALHPLEENKMVMIRQGEKGYIPAPYSEEAQSKMNEAHGNSEADLEIAVSCSMFGWDIPKVQELSPWKFAH